MHNLDHLQKVYDKKMDFLLSFSKLKFCLEILTYYQYFFGLINLNICFIGTLYYNDGMEL